MVNKYNNKIIRILIIESQELILLGLHKFIAEHPSLNIIGATNRLDIAFDMAIKNKPDVVLFDLLLNNGKCIEDITHILKACPQIKILALSCNNDDLIHLDVLRSGVAGIFSKYQRAELLFKAINVVAMGEVWFDNHIAKLLCQSQLNQAPLTANINNIKTQQSCLSERECNVACLASKGLPAKEIGKQLFISEKTVRNNLTAVYGKLAVNSQVELCIKIEQLSFCQLPDQSRDRDRCPYKKR